MEDSPDSSSVDSPLTTPSPLETPSPVETPSPLDAPPPTLATAATSPRTSLAPPRSSSSPTPHTTALDAARRPPGSSLPPLAAAMNPDIAAKMKAFSISRQGAPSASNNAVVGAGAGGGITSAALAGSSISPPSVAGFPPNFKLPPSLARPQLPMVNSAPAVPGRRIPPAKGLSLTEKRGMKLPGGLPGQTSTSPNAATMVAPAGRVKPRMTLSQIGGGSAGDQTSGSGNAETTAAGTTDTSPFPPQLQKQQSQMERYAEFIDTKTGSLKFKGKAVVTGQGIEFASGRSFSISLNEVDTLDELGKGNYGTVYKVRHSRPKFRRAGMGLAGNKAPRIPSSSTSVDDNAMNASDSPTSPVSATNSSTPTSAAAAAAALGSTSGMIMAMKEIRLELDDAKFAAIIMELDVLHRCLSPYIIDFYGAFFQEGAVYICMEWMDGGSVDALYGAGVPEAVLRKITLGTVLGLKSLKEEHNIIHRDVKPTNILVNTRGMVKICDFGVSGNLVASIAKTNIGCQSYMAPERISSGGIASAGAASQGPATYSVQSDIWSLGLSIIECALGRYPYPPETYDNIFSQLSAIVDGEPPDLPADTFSPAARDFVAGCLHKIPKLRPTYPMLLQHAWLAPIAKPQTIVEEDEEAAERAVEEGGSLPERAGGVSGGAGDGDFVDREVGMWVLEALDRRKKAKAGSSSEASTAARPALHKAPLDAGGNVVGGALA